MFQRIMDTVVRKYHVHKDIWPPETGKSFLRRQGSNNEHDRYAVALYANENYPEPGGHLPLENINTYGGAEVTNNYKNSLWWQNLESNDEMRKQEIHQDKNRNRYAIFHDEI